MFYINSNYFSFQLPFQTAMPMMLTGKSYDAKRAKKIGLVDMVVEPIGKLLNISMTLSYYIKIIFSSSVLKEKVQVLS